MKEFIDYIERLEKRHEAYKRLFEYLIEQIGDLQEEVERLKGLENK